MNKLKLEIFVEKNQLEIELKKFVGVQKYEWGDGITTIVFANDIGSVKHTYQKAGKYVIKIFDVTVIPENCMLNHADCLLTVKIPKNIILIEQWAFSNCRHLTTVKIKNGITKIGNSAFAHCLDLKIINLPNSITELGLWAFEHCISLQNIILPKNIKKIGYCTFRECVNLRTVQTPNNIKIDKMAFSGCKKLRFHSRLHKLK